MIFAFILLILLAGMLLKLGSLSVWVTVLSMAVMLLLALGAIAAVVGSVRAWSAHRSASALAHTRER